MKTFCLPVGACACSHLLILVVVVVSGPTVQHVDAFVVPRTYHFATANTVAASNARWNRFPARKLCILQTKKPEENAQEEEDYDSTTNSPKELFETMVQKVTGDDDYHFGDITKKTLSELTGHTSNTTATTASEDDDYQYQFGDISKHFVTTVGQKVTGRENYQFGDITKQTLQSLEHDLEEWKFQSLTDLPQSLFQRTLGGMSPAQRREVIVAFVRLAAIGVLAWGVVANICTAGVLSLAWMKTMAEANAAALAAATVAATKTGVIALAAPVLPILPFFSKVDPTIWRSFLIHYASFQLFLNPILLVVKAGGALLLFLPYIRCIEGIEKRLPIQWRRKGPLVSRGVALSLAFIINNLIISGAIGAALMGVGGIFAKLFLIR